MTKSTPSDSDTLQRMPSSKKVRRRQNGEKLLAKLIGKPRCLRNILSCSSWFETSIYLHGSWVDFAPRLRRFAYNTFRYNAQFCWTF